MLVRDHMQVEKMMLLIQEIDTEKLIPTAHHLEPVNKITQLLGDQAIDKTMVKWAVAKI